eukprot:6834122-Lingulodinium_polyedra.AAC.1
MSHVAAYFLTALLIKLDGRLHSPSLQECLINATKAYYEKHNVPKDQQTAWPQQLFMYTCAVEMGDKVPTRHKPTLVNMLTDRVAEVQRTLQALPL